jgi:hypothetical protein
METVPTTIHVFAEVSALPLPEPSILAPLDIIILLDTV